MFPHPKIILLGRYHNNTDFKNPQLRKRNGGRLSWAEDLKRTANLRWERKEEEFK